MQVLGIFHGDAGLKGHAGCRGWSKFPLTGGAVILLPARPSRHLHCDASDASRRSELGEPAGRCSWDGQRAADGTGTVSDFHRDTRTNNQKNEAFIAHKLLGIAFILLGSGWTYTKRWNVLFLSARNVSELLPSCPFKNVSVCSGPRRGSCLLSPAADVELFPGSSLPPGRSPWCRNVSTGAVKSDPSSVHSGYMNGECVEIEGVCVCVCVWRTRSAVGCCSSVAMDHLNTSCCIHVAWEQRCVHVQSENTIKDGELIKDPAMLNPEGGSEMWRSRGGWCCKAHLWENRW